MDDQVKYKPDSDDWDKLRGEYWEVWVGIPDYIINDSFSTRNKGKKYNKNHQWIEISQTVLEAIRNNPKTILCVQLEKDDNYDKKVVGMFPSTKSLDATIRLIEGANKRLKDDS